MPEIDGQSLLYQHQVPILDNPHWTPLLVFVLVLESLQTIVKLLSSLTIQLRRIRLNTPEQNLSFFEKLARDSPGLSLARFGSGGYPDSKCSQAIGPFKPGL